MRDTRAGLVRIDIRDWAVGVRLVEVKVPRGRAMPWDTFPFR